MSAAAPAVPRSARFYAWLSIAAAVFTIGLKLTAWKVTGSVGMLSDAAESVVNLVAALIALWALAVAERPPDARHAFGYTKVEYFSSGVEGFLIIGAAAGIAVAAWERWKNPRPIQDAWLGVGVSLAASAINGWAAAVLLSAGRRLRSITLTADGHHLLTDVWTSAGVILGIVLVALTGWQRLDPLIAAAVAVNIVWTGWRLVRETGLGLLDSALPEDERRAVTEALAPFQNEGILFHAILSRVAGRRRFVTMHVLVPGNWTVQKGHDLCEQIEAAVRRALPGAHAITHLEPREDPVSWEDRGLDRR
ncbi:MAG: cation diffusion facilitator family transporter [Thermoanaerobaculia bacterium]